jgi:CRP-like cAMP-binding protein
LRPVYALATLPATRISEVPKRTPVYSATYPSDRFYLVLGGRVRIHHVSEQGAQTLVRIAGPEELFGGCSLVSIDRRLREAAVTIEAAQLMSWRGEEVERQMEQHPRLALALCEYFALANSLTVERISAMKFATGPRVTIALMQLAQGTGRRQSDGAMRLCGLTHQAISEYVGTSREMVTVGMTGFVASATSRTPGFIRTCTSRRSQNGW